ncbi:helix-turn-helix domain-containing protein [Agromyces ramosus]|uniref:Transcriptional regulator with XRE-family HTH domain n=1 Tax=Agromyces ramosus TaxID=33879 RepID=A0ABU0R8S2_9MICO|nr:transcriptional regulator with XRE-family HTH domain [Agromyces ramosus]
MPGVLNRALARILFAQMQESSMTQTELARKVGLAPSTVSRALHCKTPMTVDQLEAFCKALRLDPSAVIAEASR